MSTILLSFEPDWFYKLETGEKKFEYRKHFPEGQTTVYFYVSQPVKAITGIAHFDVREKLEDWKVKYADRPQEVCDRIEDFSSDCRFAMPLLSFQPTNRIPLSQLQHDIPGFIVPRMYYYIDDSDLLLYLNRNLVPQGPALHHTFETIADNDIC